MRAPNPRLHEDASAIIGPMLSTQTNDAQASSPDDGQIIDHAL
jgi:hypothetical protein